MIKARIVKLHGPGAKAAAIHFRYLQRDGVTPQGAAGELYGPESDRADAASFLDRTNRDRHQFRFIVSIEDGAEYSDLKPVVRRLMARVEHDLGTKLDWVAVDHYNTGHPHTHIVLRGRDAVEQDLVIARDYIAHGMRERAAEIVTLDLGPHSDLEIEDRLHGQVRQERWTDLDQALCRAATPDGLVSAAADGRIARHHLAARLQMLEQLRLAEEAQPGQWRLAPDLEASLRAMGERADIIKTMHRQFAAWAIGGNGADFAIPRNGEASGQPVTGRVVARGPSDEHPGLDYLIVDGTDGRVHYAEVSEDAEDVAPEAIVRLGWSPRSVRAIDRTVAAVAQRNGGIYSTANHQKFDPNARPEFIAAHIRRLEALRRLARIAERRPDGSWLIPKEHAEHSAVLDRHPSVRRMEVLSHTPLEKLATARAQTWLDRELLADAPMPLGKCGFGYEVRQALKQRRAWLLEQGLAREELGRTVFRRDLLRHLRRSELARAGTKLAVELGKRYESEIDTKIEGRYRGPVYLVSGKFAIIEKSREFSLVPWRPVLERRRGGMVSGIGQGDTFSWTVGRSRGPTIG